MKNLSLRDLRKNKKKKKGFTLVELIIVIAIMAILSAVAIPKFGQVTKNANITADIATAKNYHGIAAQAIADEPALVPATGATDKDLTSKVAENVDGGAQSTEKPLGDSKTTKQAFSVYVDANGNITVYSGDKTKATETEVYPNQGTNFAKTTNS